MTENEQKETHRKAHEKTAKRRSVKSKEEGAEERFRYAAQEEQRQVAQSNENTLTEKL